MSEKFDEITVLITLLGSPGRYTVTGGGEGVVLSPEEAME